MSSFFDTFGGGPFTVAGTADGYLAAASDLLVDNAGREVQLANTAGLAPGEADALRAQFAANEQAVTRITGNAAFNGVKLFNGTYSLQVGGGRLELPDLANSVPTQQALAALRGEDPEEVAASSWSVAERFFRL